ncbi:hypothetical protein MLD38_018208 [Melastoma candidum]|uniref:Uncharacterized protein n=1 Tax=Melastoma candidum TaxID=119954 RepID=A0ACB9QT43_9MYRT|nr:hypothetical protein MLD38_018208 [Melastoma candidum]
MIWKLIEQLEALEKAHEESRRALEDVTREKESLILEKEAALRRIEDKEKASSDRKVLLDGIKDEKAAIVLELESVKGEVSSMANQMELVEQTIAELRRNLETAEEENKSLASKLSELSSQIEESRRVMEEATIESEQLKQSLVEKEREFAAQGTKSELQTKISSGDQAVADLEETVEDLRRELELKGDEISSLMENVRTIEVKHRLSNQKLQVTEQLLTEREESFRIAEAKYQQEQRALEEKIAALSEILVTYRKAITDITEGANSCFAGLEEVMMKFDSNYSNYSSRISDMCRQLQVAKEWAAEADSEKNQQKVEISQLSDQLKREKEQGSALRDHVERLEEKVAEEVAAKDRLSAALCTIEEKIGELKVKLKEKDEGIHELGEEEKEAIRQRCIWIDYHRSRYNDIRDALMKSRGIRAAAAQRAGS